MSYIKNKYKFVIVSSVVFAVIAGFVFSVDTYPVQGASYLGCKAIKTLTGHYAVAEGGGGGAMNANITAISDWGKFEIMDVGNGEIAFKTFAGYYAVAEGGGGGDLNANRTAVGGWEKFRIIDVGGGKVAFQTLTGHYAVAEGGGGGAMNANRTAIGGWEQFELVDTSGCSAPKPTATPAPSQPTVSNLPTCSTGSYNATISWTGTPNSSFGFYVDIDDGDQNFGTFYNKNVGSVTSTDASNFKGLWPNTNQTLSLQPGTTYYTRVYNGEHSQAKSFSVPVCSTPTQTPTGRYSFTTSNYRGGNTPVITRPNLYDYQPSVMLDNGKYRAWWCGGIAGDFIYYSESIAMNGPWSNPQYVFTNRNNPNDGVLYFDELHVCDPSVIKAGSTYYMYYGGNDDVPNNANGETNIGVASSPDGINWTRLNNGNPIIMGARLPGSSGYSSLVNKYGAGQPSATYVNGYFYITFTDTTGLASNTGNGAGQYILRSTDPTFQTNVEELVGPSTFAPKTSSNHTTYSWIDAFGLDWQFSDLLNAFVIASHWASDMTHIVFKDFSLPSAELASRVTINGQWREGPGLVSSPDGHSLSKPGGIIPLDVMRAVGTSDVNSWDLAYVGVDLNTGVSDLSQPTVSNLPTCSTGSYNATISWTGTPNSSFGFYVDIDDGDQNFGTFYNKNVGSVTSTDASNFKGLWPNTNQTLSLQPGTTYYTRVYNGEHSQAKSFSVPVCSTPTQTPTSTSMPTPTPTPISTPLTDPTLPYCISAGIDGTSVYPGTTIHTVYAYGVNRATSMHFPTYTEVNGQENDLIWYQGTYLGNGIWKADINPDSHPGSGRTIVHAYMHNDSYRNIFCDSADFTKETTKVDPGVLPKPVVANLPVCSNSSYSVTIIWAGQKNPSFGYYIDISEDQSFSSAFWNKNLQGTLVAVPGGFNVYPPGSALPTLSLSPGKTYYARVFNGQHSPVTSFSVLTCN